MKFSIKIVAFLHRSRKGRDSYLCPLASVNYTLLSTEHCLFYLSFSNTLISFWEKFYLKKNSKIFSKKKQLIQSSSSTRSILRENISFFNIVTGYLMPIATIHSSSPFYSRHITQLKRVRLRKRSSAPPRSFSIFAFDRQIALYGPSI